MRRGIVCYDAHCPICMRLVRRFSHSLRRAGFHLVALQDAGIQQRLGITRVPDEMKLILPSGQVQGGIDAVITLSEALGLARNIADSARSRYVRPALKRMYVFVAKHRGCSGNSCQVHYRDVH